MGTLPILNVRKDTTFYSLVSAMHLHFIGIAGTAMGSVAVACAEAGYHVTGSDEGVYPPMSDVLSAAGIRWHNGFDGDRLLGMAPDLVVVGNAISRGNTELEAVLDHRLPMTSMAGFIGTHFIDRNTSIVCTGTHGKTTTSSMTAWILEHAGRRPGFLIGGVPYGFRSGCRAVPAEINNTHAGVFVSEGDEYDTAFFDKRSKFVHYRPTIAIINNIEFDHADIFDSIDDIVWSFQQMIRIVPRTGCLFVNADDPVAVDAVKGAPAPVHLVGFGPEATIQITVEERSSEGSTWALQREGEPLGTFRLSMTGDHNLRNATMAVLACVEAGVTADEARLAIAAYQPPKRRLEVIGTWQSCTVVDDFAHHPTAIRATIQALAQQYPQSRLHVIFEPRSNTTTRAFFQHELAACFAGAASVCVGPVNRPERYSVEDRLNTTQLVADLGQQAIPALSLSPDRATDPSWGADVVPWLEQHAREGDVIAILSNGNVGSLRSILTA